jgi:hypothetical protein
MAPSLATPAACAATWTDPFCCPVCGTPLRREGPGRTRRTRAQIADRVPVHVVRAERIRVSPWVCDTGLDEHRRDFDRTRHVGGEVAWLLHHIQERRREFLPPVHPDRQPWRYTRDRSAAGIER